MKKKLKPWLLFVTSRQKIIAVLVLPLALFLLSFVVRVTRNSAAVVNNNNNNNNYNIGEEKEKDVQIFQLVTEQRQKLPSHLDFINPQTDLESIGFQQLDYVHRNGMIHSGAWILLIDTNLSSDDYDSSARILLLKRGKDLVTCANTWQPIGEHAYRDESSLETVKRAVSEELGSTFRDYVDGDTDTSDGSTAAIQNLTEYPLYYERHYGPSNGNRIDRQITYLWLIEMNFNRIFKEGKQQSHDEIDKLLRFDDEVADHMWITLNDLQKWVNSDVLFKDFCHHTIVSLLRVGIDRMKMVAKSRDAQ